MDRKTKGVAGITAGIAVVGLAAIFWMAAVGQTEKLAEAARGGMEGVWEVSASLIALAWMIWGWRRVPKERGPMAWGERKPERMALRTKWGIAATVGAVAATIAVLCVYGNGAEVSAELMREFSVTVFNGTAGTVALVWGIWWWVGRRG